jgi:hypothetical protein
MEILSDIIDFLFNRKKKPNEEIRTAMERISPYKFLQELADYAQSLGFTVGEGVRDSGFSLEEPNYAVHGIQFKMYGMVVAVGFNTILTDRYTAGIYYTSGSKEGGGSGGFAGPFTLTTLKMCKEDLYKFVVRLKENNQKIKLDSINEDFV